MSMMPTSWKFEPTVVSAPFHAVIAALNG